MKFKEIDRGKKSLILTESELSYILAKFKPKMAGFGQF